MSDIVKAVTEWNQVNQKAKGVVNEVNIVVELDYNAINNLWIVRCTTMDGARSKEGFQERKQAEAYFNSLVSQYDLTENE